jgi:hypothetical protein
VYEKKEWRQETRDRFVIDSFSFPQLRLRSCSPWKGARVQGAAENEDDEDDEERGVEPFGRSISAWSIFKLYPSFRQRTALSGWLEGKNPALSHVRVSYMNHQRDRLRKQCCSSCLSSSCFLVNYIKDPIIVYTVVFISLDYNIKKGPVSAPWPVLFLFCSLLALTYNSRPWTCFHSPLGRQVVAGSLDAVENYN